MPLMATGSGIKGKYGEEMGGRERRGDGMRQQDKLRLQLCVFGPGPGRAVRGSGLSLRRSGRVEMFDLVPIAMDEMIMMIDYYNNTTSYKFSSR